MKVLVVDDRKENIEAAKIAFSDLNLNVVYASSAKEAMGIIEEKAFFDLVISDLEMRERKWQRCSKKGVGIFDSVVHCDWTKIRK